MAEFCLECLRRVDGVNHDEDDFVYSEELELCEGCGEMKHIVVKYREETFTEFLKRIVLKELQNRNRDL